MANIIWSSLEMLRRNLVIKKLIDQVLWKNSEVWKRLIILEPI